MANTEWRVIGSLSVLSVVLFAGGPPAVAGSESGASVTDKNLDAAVATITASVNAWGQRKDVAPAVANDHQTARSSNAPLSETPYRAAVRAVTEVRIGRLALASSEGLVKALTKPDGTPPVLGTLTPEDIRRYWRNVIIDDVTTAPGTAYPAEAAGVLAPMLAAIVAGYNDAAGKPDRVVRANALLILQALPGTTTGKTNAMRFLLQRRKDVDEGVLLIIVRDLGKSKIDAARPEILGFLKSGSVVLQAAAARALGSIGNAADLDALLAALDSAGDSIDANPDHARDLVLGIIEGIGDIAKANALKPPVSQKVMAAMMRRVLCEADRVIVAAAAGVVKTAGNAPVALSAAEKSEAEFQTKVEALRVWWLQQPKAEEYYQDFFRPERM